MQAGAAAAAHAPPFSSNLSSPGSCTRTCPQKMWAFQIRAFNSICRMSLGSVCACRLCRIEETSSVLIAASMHRICCLGTYLGGHWPRDASRLPLLAVSLLACRASISTRPAMERRSFRLQMPVPVHAGAWPAQPQWLCKHKTATTLQTLQRARGQAVLLVWRCHALIRLSSV